MTHRSRISSGEIVKQNRRMAIEHLKMGGGVAKLTRDECLRMGNEANRRPVETLEGVFRSLREAARYHRLALTTADSRVRTGKWRYLTI